MRYQFTYLRNVPSLLHLQIDVSFDKERMKGDLQSNLFTLHIQTW